MDEYVRVEDGPYSYKRKYNGWFFGFTYRIYFEDTHIRTIQFTDRDYIEELVRLLNTAWTLGFGSGVIHGKMINQSL